jgi:ABC-type sugar transport system substrate-binding protein
VKALRLAGFVCTVAAATVAAIGCGGSDSGGTGGGGSGSASAGGTCVKEAKQLVNEYRAPIPLKSPESPVEMSKAKGKTLWIVSIDDTPFVQQATDGFMEAAKAAGMTGKFFDAKGNITRANQAVATAVSQDAGGIVLWAIDPKNVAGELAKAEAKGIPAIDVNASKPDAPPAPGIFGHVTSDWTLVGKMFADYMLAESNCELTAGILSIKSIPIFVDAEKGTQAEIERLCQDCKSHVDYINLATIATSIGPLAQTAITRNPDTKWITPIADAFGALIEPAISQSGKDVSIIAHDGAEHALKSIRDGNSLIKATVSTPPPPYYGWAFVDQIGRAIAGQEPADWELPNQIIDSTNIGESDAELFPKYANFEDSFKKAWGVE